MEIKSITLLDNRDIEITTDKGTIKVSKKNPVYEGLRLQFFSWYQHLELGWESE